MKNNTANNSNYYFALIVIFIVPIWSAINKWIINMDGAGRIPLFLLIINLVWMSIGVSSVSYKKPITYYLLFALYLFINGLCQDSYLNYEGNGVYIMFINLFMPPMYMLLLTYLAYLDFDKTLNWVTWSLITFCVMCLFYGEVTESGRLEGELNANGMASFGTFCFYCLLLQYMRGRRSLIGLLTLSIIPILLIVITGSRTAFILLVFVAFLSVLLFYKKGNFGSIIVFALLAVALIVGVDYVMNNTILGERLSESTTQMEGSSLETGTIIDKFGDRGPQYYWSWPYFLQHPIFGIGLGNWRKVSGFPYVFHSEWLIHYCENGIIALLLYLQFFISLYRSLVRSSKHVDVNEKKSYKVVLYVLLSVVFMNFVSWTYNAYYVFAFYSFAFALIQKVKLNHLNNK